MRIKAGNKLFSVQNDFLGKLDGETIMSYLGPELPVTIPENITDIHSDSFCNDQSVPTGTG